MEVNAEIAQYTFMMRTCAISGVKLNHTPTSTKYATVAPPDE